MRDNDWLRRGKHIQNSKLNFLNLLACHKLRLKFI